MRILFFFAAPLAVIASITAGAQSPSNRKLLLDPAAAEFREPAPARTLIRFDTTRGPLVIEVLRDWAPLGASRFVSLAKYGYYDEARFFRVRPATWVQFGIAGDPAVARAWRTATFPDDPFRQSNVRGTVAFAFAVPNGRTAQVFINLRDNSATHDGEPFVPFGRVVEGMAAADAFTDEYREGLGGVRAGRQDAAFAEGNVFFQREYPRLDYIIRSSVTASR